MGLNQDWVSQAVALIAMAGEALEPVSVPVTNGAFSQAPWVGASSLGPLLMGRVQEFLGHRGPTVLWQEQEGGKG